MSIFRERSWGEALAYTGLGAILLLVLGVVFNATLVLLYLAGLLPW